MGFFLYNYRHFIYFVHYEREREREFTWLFFICCFFFLFLFDILTFIQQSMHWQYIVFSQKNCDMVYMIIYQLLCHKNYSGLAFYNSVFFATLLNTCINSFWLNWYFLVSISGSSISSFLLPCFWNFIIKCRLSFSLYLYRLLISLFCIYFKLLNPLSNNPMKGLSMYYIYMIVLIKLIQKLTLSWRCI